MQSSQAAPWFSDVRSMIPEGLVGQRVEGNVRQWLSVAPFANFAIFESFLKREGQDRWPLSAWHGEFPGKLLTSMGECLRLSRGDDREKLLSAGDFVVEQLSRAQDTDGYLGCFPRSQRLIGLCFDQHTKTGDLWGHYHCLYGLLLWYHQTGSVQALEVCKKAADYLCAFFAEGVHALEEAGLEHFNMGAVHVFALLYQQTGRPSYRAMAERFEKTFLAQAYREPALRGVDFYQMANPRWEVLHAFLALPPLSDITGDDIYRTAFLRLWESIRRTDVHNTGAFSTGEGANGNPYPIVTDEFWRCSIELCCCIAWTAMTTSYLRLTHSSLAADELERGFYNALLGSQHPTGRWVTYDSPMVGRKLPSSMANAAQAKSGSPEFNCCAANAGRILGTMSNWAVMTEGNTVYVNYYGAGQIETAVEGQTVMIKQETTYPLDGKITLRLFTDGRDKITVGWRIPAWSKQTDARLNGIPLEVHAGSYLLIDRVWRPDDVLTLTLDMSLHYLVSDERYNHKASIFRGPLLLACDERFNADGCLTPPRFSLERMAYTVVEETAYPAPFIKLSFTDDAGQTVFLTDFATAGMTGTLYTTWFALDGTEKLSAKEALADWCLRP